ncbi:MAG TPA: nucleoside monophosphate kinase [Acidobacteriota bacterium]|nr:nucleoside monophosphate kinase [Acidobacteriota bacterium]
MIGFDATSLYESGLTRYNARLPQGIRFLNLIAIGGAGKGTQTQMIVSERPELGIYVSSDALRAYLPTISSIKTREEVAFKMDKGFLVEDEHVLNAFELQVPYMRKNIEDKVKSGYILDGLNRTAHQVGEVAAHIRNDFGNHRKPFDITTVIDVSNDISLERMTYRGIIDLLKKGAKSLRSDTLHPDKRIILYRENERSLLQAVQEQSAKLVRVNGNYHPLAVAYEMRRRIANPDLSSDELSKDQFYQQLVARPSQNPQLLVEELKQTSPHMSDMMTLSALRQLEEILENKAQILEDIQKKTA